MSYKYRLFAELIGRSTRTLLLCDNEGRFIAKRTISNQISYDNSK